MHTSETRVKIRADLLQEIQQLPGDALLTTQQAAALLGTSPSVLANWRSRRRGPSYCGNKGFIRYRRDLLQLWVSERASDVRSQGGARDD
jgi:hypothetical protein